MSTLHCLIRLRLLHSRVAGASCVHLQGDSDSHYKAMVVATARQRVSCLSNLGVNLKEANVSALQAKLQQFVEFSYETRICFQNIFASYTRKINSIHGCNSLYKLTTQTKIVLKTNQSSILKATFLSKYVQISRTT